MKFFSPQFNAQSLTSTSKRIETSAGDGCGKQPTGRKEEEAEDAPCSSLQTSAAHYVLNKRDLRWKEGGGETVQT